MGNRRPSVLVIDILVSTLAGWLMAGGLSILEYPMSHICISRTDIPSRTPYAAYTTLVLCNYSVLRTLGNPTLDNVEKTGIDCIQGSFSRNTTAQSSPTPAFSPVRPYTRHLRFHIHHSLQP